MKLKLYTSEGVWEITHYKTLAVIGLILSSPIAAILVILYKISWEAALITVLSLVILIVIRVK